MGEEVDAQKALQFKGATYPVSFNKRDLIVYALGIGETDLQFTYEDHDNFSAFPTYPVALTFKGTSQEVVPFPPKTMLTFPEGIPMINPAMILHGEQEIEIITPLNPEGEELTAHQSVLSLWDKGKGALLEMETVMKNQKGESVCRMISGSFMRGLTGFKGAGRQPPPRAKAPSRAPDAVETISTYPNQAALYRLSGDYNALHIDPSIAQAVGFKRPIIHGLCSMGIATRAILKALAGGDPKKLKKISVRFSSPAYPGETFVTSMWKEGDRVIFQTKIKERDVIVLDGGVAVLEGAAASTPSSSTQGSSSSTRLQSEGLLKSLEAAVTQNGEKLVRQVGAVFLFKISASNGQTVAWTVDLKNGKGRVAQEEGPADLTINVSDADFVQLAAGKLNPQQAFMKGKIKLKGNMSLAMKLKTVLDSAKPQGKL